MTYFYINNDTSLSPAAILMPPKTEDKEGRITEGTPFGAGYMCGELYILDQVCHIDSGIYKIERRIENRGSTAAYFKDCLDIETAFAGEKYLFPAVLYNGNHQGTSGTPKGLIKDGKPWVFAYDRMSIPSCTVTENKDISFSLFASNRDPLSLTSSASLIKKDNGCYIHRIIRPVTEAPYTYSSKCIMTERYDTYNTLRAGESMSTLSYAVVERPMYESYGAAGLLRAAEKLLCPVSEPTLTPERVRELGVDFAKALLYDYKGQKLIITHYAQRLFRYQHMVKITPSEMAEMMKDPYYTELGAFDERFEMGWADQGLLNGRMLGEYAIEKNDRELLRISIGIFDAFCKTQKENGLAFTLYEQNYEENAETAATPDCCNLGWGAAEMVRMYRMLKKHNIDKEEYLDFACRVCDFFEKAQSDEYGYGKSYYIDGRPADSGGSVGGFMITAMLEVYNETKNEKYLDSAVRASDFYYKRDLDNFVCTAGALDCQSVDKETAYPFLTSSLMLYGITKDEKYIERAKKAAYYFTSWMFFYDVLYPNGSEFTQYGYNTAGGTAISAEHHAIDSWGSVIVPELTALARLTDDDFWLRIARLMWANSILGLTEREGQLFHGMQRPIGAQNEGFFQARWTKYRPTCEERGHFNDCLSAWCGAYRMYTVSRLKEMGELDVIACHM